MTTKFEGREKKTANGGEHKKASLKTKLFTVY